MADDRQSPLFLPDEAMPANASSGLTRAELDALVLAPVTVSALIVDREFDGRVSLGCTVRVAADAGETAQYTLVGRRSEASRRHEVTPGSPVGKALLGARPGHRVRVELPGGRKRALRILDVMPSILGPQMAAHERDAEAA